MYLGKVQEQTFSDRILQHSDWMEKEFSELHFYIGRIGSIYKVNDRTWGDEIDKAERLLIYYSSPPYNSQFINYYGNITKTLILNFGKKNRLPIEVSTVWKSSDCLNNNEWEYHKNNNS